MNGYRPTDSEPGWYLFHCVVCCKPMGILPRVYWEHKGRKTLPAFVAHTTCMGGVGFFERMVICADARISSSFYRTMQLN